MSDSHDNHRGSNRPADTIKSLLPRSDENTDLDDKDLENISYAMAKAIAKFESDRVERERPKKEEDQYKERLKNHVSIAVISLSMLMSFLNFARTERSSAAGSASGDATSARARAATSWSHYQTTTAERANYRVASDALKQSIAGLAANDPRVGEAHVQFIEYETRMSQIDHENEQVFFLIQDLEKRAVKSDRTARAIERSVDRYDLGARVLTLALVLLSVTLLTSRRYLFWSGVGIAGIGAIIAVNGYFLWW